MQLFRTLAAAALGSTALATASFASPQSTVQVGTCKAHLTSYATISQALASVPVGYTIDVCPGIYPEQLSVTQNVTITGVDTGGQTGNGASQARLVVPAAGFVANATDPDQNGQPIVAQIAVSNASSVTINNITVDGSNGDFSSSGCETDIVGILYQNASGTVSNNAVLNTNLNDANLFGCQDGLAIYAQTSGSGQSQMTISGNYIDGFQKNGITVDDSGVVASISGNTVLGIGPTSVIGQNSVQVAFGAKASVQSNDVGDDVYTPSPTSSGILIYDSLSSSASNNVVTNAQYAIAVVADAAGKADKPGISDNQIETAFDAVDICGSSNGNVTGNAVDGAANAAIHVDASCQLATSLASAVNNRINQACAGVLEGSGTTVSALNSNTFLSVADDVLTGTDTCSAADAMIRQRTHVAVFR